MGDLNPWVRASKHVRSSSRVIWTWIAGLQPDAEVRGCRHDQWEGILGSAQENASVIIRQSDGNGGFQLVDLGEYTGGRSGYVGTKATNESLSERGRSRWHLPVYVREMPS